MNDKIKYNDKIKDALDNIIENSSINTPCYFEQLNNELFKEFCHKDYLNACEPEYCSYRYTNTCNYLNILKYILDEYSIDIIRKEVKRK